MLTTTGVIGIYPKAMHYGQRSAELGMLSYMKGLCSPADDISNIDQASGMHARYTIIFSIRFWIWFLGCPSTSLASEIMQTGVTTT